MLLIGAAQSNYMLGQIAYFETVRSAEKAYGQSALMDGFRLAKDFGVAHVFLLNIKNTYDYFEIATLLKHNDFAYIVPTDIFMSDYYDDTYRGNRKTSYFRYLLEEIGLSNQSTFIVTDKHASLYEDVDAFLTEMHALDARFASAMTAGMQGQNIIFVANNLIDYPLANVVAASALCTSELNEYPELEFGNAVFDIDPFDIRGSFAYFKSHTLLRTSLENLLNYHEIAPEKIVTIDRIIKFIKRELDFSEFKGRVYSGYQRLQIEKKLRSYLTALKNYVLEDFNIELVTPYRDSPATVTVLNRFDVWPINSIEKCTIEMGVEV